MYFNSCYDVLEMHICICTTNRFLTFSCSWMLGGWLCVIEACRYCFVRCKSKPMCVTCRKYTGNLCIMGYIYFPKLLYTKVLVGHESIQSLHISQQVETEQDRIGKNWSGTGHKFPLIRESEMSWVIEVNMTGVQHKLGLSLIQP